MKDKKIIPTLENNISYYVKKKDYVNQQVLKRLGKNKRYFIGQQIIGTENYDK
jgi:hypothetical protein